VQGRLLVDDTHFDRLLANDGWKRSFVPGEVGPLSAFLVDGNHRSDTATLNDPAMANLVRFQSALTKAGITVSGALDRGTTGIGSPALASHTSAPLVDLVTHMLLKSDNTYAEVVLKELGASAGTPSTLGGIAAITKQFDRYGVVRPVLADGSGLSTLSKVDASRVAAAFRAGLPVACVSGTLKNRLCASVAAKNVTAKTGTLDYISTLAGYATTAKGRRVVFSVLLSRLPSQSKARLATDQVMIAITSYAG
jgi:serine-type D-Ala-D-Ala carboxypeptidase/endopeptidase (penicillin-binding protein 4)